MEIWNKNPDLRNKKMYTIEIYNIDENIVYARESFEKEGDLYYYYSFNIFDKNENLLTTINLESSLIIRSMDTMYILGADIYDDGKRIHKTYNIGFKELPEYEELKRLVKMAFENKLEVGAQGVYPLHK